MMTPRLTRIAYGIMLFIVALTLVINLPPLEKIGKTPSSQVVTFSIDHWVTEIHRNLQKARRAELRADHLREQRPSDAGEYYRNSLYYLSRAGEYARRRGSGSYVDDLIYEARNRLHEKIAETT